MTVQIDLSRTVVYKPMKCKVTCIACRLQKCVGHCDFGVVAVSRVVTIGNRAMKSDTHNAKATTVCELS